MGFALAWNQGILIGINHYNPDEEHPFLELNIHLTVFRIIILFR
jgi:hypothetical protein|tara:strand:- start:9688 stop:9819 length:132 start_codon:yes stop_codon:yes gene_type:complete